MSEPIMESVTLPAVEALDLKESEAPYGDWLDFEARPWMDRLTRFGGEIQRDGDKFQFSTERNKYTITAKMPPGTKGYLGCIACSRFPRTGENWLRGNDLADGAFTAATWGKILADIIAFELAAEENRIPAQKS